MNVDRARPLAAFVLVTALCAGVMVEGLRPLAGAQRATRAEAAQPQPVLPGPTLDAVDRRTTRQPNGTTVPAVAVRPGVGATSAGQPSTAADRPRRPREAGATAGTPHAQAHSSSSGHEAQAGSVSTGSTEHGKGHGKKPAKRPTKKPVAPLEQSVKQDAGQPQAHGKNG